MQKLKFINALGDSLTFSNQAPYLITGITGTGEIDVDIQTSEAPFQDGSTFIDSYLEPRYIEIEIDIIAGVKESIFDKRRELSKVFNPKLGMGTLVYEHDGYVKEIKAISNKTPIFPSGNNNRFGKYQKSMITLFCPSPLWMDIDDITEELEAWVGTFNFPFTFPVTFDQKGTSKFVVNKGDVSTPVLIKFRGPALNPKVSNLTTGEFIKVNRELLDGEVLEINTEFGNKRVEIISPDGTRTNVFYWIDINSSFFQLEVGESELEYDADTGVNNASVLLSYRNRYNGI